MLLTRDMARIIIVQERLIHITQITR